MPVTGNAISNSIILAGTANFSGTQFRKISKSVGSSVSTWIKVKANVPILGSTTGAVGSGRVTGKMAFVPATPAMVATFAANGLTGSSARKLATAIANGVVISLNATAAYQGQSVGAIGADVSKVTFANPGTLIPILKTNMASQTLLGFSTAALSSAIAQGVAAIVISGVGAGVSVGGAGPFPSTGVSNSSIF